MKIKSLRILTCSVLLLALASVANAQWVQTNGPSGGTVRSLVVSGTNLFAGTDPGGVFLSTNNGTGWTAVNTGLTNTNVHVLAVSGTNLFAGTFGTVFLSTNNGTSWTAASTGLPSYTINDMAVSGTNLFAGINIGVFLSTNNGTSWTEVNSGLSNTNIRALAVSGTNLFAATVGGIFLSTNNGTSWTAASTGLTNTDVRAFAVSGTNLFAGTSGGVFLSTNNGTSWTAVNIGLPTNVDALAVSGTNLFAGTFYDGVFLSTNNGTSWTAVNTGLTNIDVFALAVSGTNLFAGNFGGGVWRRPLSEMIGGSCTAVAIGTQPQSQTVPAGSTATFSISVNGTAPFLYFWYKNGIQISGANSSSYTTGVLSPSDNGSTFQCIVTNCNSSNQVVSNNAVLTVATTLVKVSGDNQSGPILTQLPNPFVVRVTAQDGTPIPGYTVNFSLVTGGGSLSLTQAVTNPSGEAQTQLTFGSSPVVHEVLAVGQGLTNNQSFTATAVAGQPTTLATVSGDSQATAVLSQLPNPFVVLITDQGGNPLSGYSVNFAIVGTPPGATGQILSDTVAITDGAGRARSFLTMGNRIGPYQVRATRAGLSGSPRQFSATATLGSPTVLSTVSGTSQTAPILTQLASPFTVRVTDQGGNPISGFTVNFEISSSPVSSSGQNLSATSSITNANGEAQSTLTLGNKVGAYVVNATGLGLTGNPQQFSASATKGPADLLQVTSGSNQTGPILAQLGNPFVVRVVDAGGNPIPGFLVNFAIDSIPNGASGYSLSAASGNTDTNGRTQTTLTLGNLVGQYRVRATASVPNGALRFFSATAVPAGAPRLSTMSGNNQTRQIMTLLDSLVVEIRDSLNNPVAFRPVSFSIALAPGGATSQSLSDTVVNTNAAGRAATRFRLGNKVGLYSVQARSTGAINSPQTFSSTATAGAARTLLTVSGTGQSPQPIGTLLQPFVVQVQDTGQNTIPSFNVRFQLVSNPGGGAPVDTTVSTDSSGTARVRLRLGFSPGNYQMNATAAIAVGNPQAFTASAITGAARSLQTVSGNNQNGQVLTQLANPFIVQVADSTGNPISGFNITFAILQRPSNATGDTLSSIGVSTGSDGKAQTYLRLGNRSGSYVVTASGAGLMGSPLQFVATANAGSATSMQKVSGDNTSGRVLTQLPEPFVVQAFDQSGNPVSGLGVSFTVTSRPSGASTDSLIVVTGSTDSSGKARAILRLGNKVGNYKVTASAGLIPPQEFTSTALPGTARVIQIFSGNNQIGQTLSILYNPLVVRVTDTTGNPVPGSAVSFSITGRPVNATRDTLLVSSPTTDVNGQAQTYIRLGDRTGTYEVTATGLIGSPLLFTATATSGTVTATVVTNSADTIRFTTAILHGAINPAGQSGTGYFEWGTSNTLVNPTRTSTVNIPLSISPVGIRQVLTGLTPNFTYYFRAVGEIGAQTLTGGIISFTTLDNSARASGTIDFPSNPSSDTHYKFVSLPGTNPGTVNDLIQGAGSQQQFDWRVYRDNGANVAYPAYLQEMGASEQVRVGEGYWMVRKNPLSISQRQLNLPALSPEGNALIDLHTGWNIVANPFHVSVPWAAVVQANGLTNSVLSGYEGGYTNETALQPFRAYYFDNRTAGLDSLKIPYPFTFINPVVPDQPIMQWKVKIEFTTGINNDKENYIGIATAARAGYDSLELRKPPLFGHLGYLYFERREWDSEFSNFSTDFRPVIGEGQVWEFEVVNPLRGRSSFRFVGIDDIPEGLGVVLIDLNNTTPFDLRQSAMYNYQTVNDKMKFKLVVGTQAFIGQQSSALVPGEFALMQNYPNPFNPSTSISFAVPHEASVQLEIYSILGQRVATLINSRLSAAFHTVVWEGKRDDGIGVASGVFFYRLIADGNVVRTRKMIFTK